jgi:hypothetical protein
MLMNHTHQARAAWIRYHMKIDTRRLRAVTPYWFSVMGCHVDPQFSVPGAGSGESSTYKRSHSFVVPRDGRIVAVGGHLHGGGRDIRLKQPRCGDRTLVRSKPTYGPTRGTSPGGSPPPGFRCGGGSGSAWWRAIATTSRTCA